MDVSPLFSRKSHHSSWKCRHYALFTRKWSDPWVFVFIIFALAINCTALSFVIALNNKSLKKRKRRSRCDGTETEEEAAEQVETTSNEPLPRNGPYQLVNNLTQNNNSISLPTPVYRYTTSLLKSITKSLPSPGLKPRHLTPSTQRRAVPPFVQSTLLLLLTIPLLFTSALAFLHIALCPHPRKFHHPALVSIVIFGVLGVPQVVLTVLAGCNWVALLAKVCGWKLSTGGVFRAGMMVVFGPVLVVYALGTWAVGGAQRRFCLSGEEEEEEEEELEMGGEEGERERGEDVEHLGAFIDEDAGEIVFDGEEDEDEEDEGDRPPSYDGVMAEGSSAANASAPEVKI
ncbi:MAG: hypothetical protein Q9227_005432 [Pyrenula ochraceoflavens]